jgi:hypothetical protein
MKNLEKFSQLPFNKQRILVEALLLITAMRISLRVLPYHIIRWFLFKRDSVFDIRHQHENDISQDIIWAIKKAGKFTLRDNSCLILASAGCILLRLHGCPAQLRLGIQKCEDGAIVGHAWVESDSKVVIGAADREIERYIPLLE